MSAYEKKKLLCFAIYRKRVIKQMIHNSEKSADVSVKIAFVQVE